MVPTAAKKPTKPSPKKAVPTAAKKPAAPSPKALALKGKKVAAPKGSTVPTKVAPGAVPASAPEVPATPPPIEVNANEKHLCWIELVKNGNIFIARSNTTGGPNKEYKNRVLEDMLTELIVELQEEIQE